MSGVAWIIDPRRQVITDASYVAAAGAREVSWRWELLSHDDEVLDEFTGVESAAFRGSVAAAVPTGGSLVWRGWHEVPAWNTFRLRPVMRASHPSGEVIEWSPGVFLPSAPEVRWGSGASCQVELYDKTQVLTQDKLKQTFSAALGSNGIAHVKALIASAGEDRMSVTGDTVAVRAPMSWPPGTPKLTVINDILTAIGYAPLRCDWSGQFVIVPYVDPTQRPVVREFVAGSGSVHLPEWTLTADTFNVPNEVIVWGRDDVAPQLRGYWSNTSPDSPSSYPSRGNRWITETVENSDAATQSAIDAEAKRIGMELSAPVETVTMRHVALGDPLDTKVRFKPSRGGVDLLAVVREWSISTALGAMVETQIQRVAA